eukprot:11132697-Alexandrium_andersonii.AAC.1
MSASLVGSEMCIRDRRPQKSSGRDGQRSRSGSTRRARSASSVFTVPITCLLYTSDAADDM